MTPASLALAAARNACDHATLALWASQSELLAALAAGDPAAVAQWRAVVAADSRTLSLADDARALAFDALAAERAAACDVRLVARELTPDEEAGLAATEFDLALARRIHARGVECDHALQSGVLHAIAVYGPSEAEECRDALRSGYALTDAWRDRVDAALAARAPLLAARWQEVAT